MTDIIPQPRANRHGSACPDWCDIDHAKPVYNGERPIDTHISATMGSGRSHPRVLLTQFSDEHKVDSQPEVQLEGTSGFVAVSAGMAGHLAALIESLADCHPQKLRDLADEIRVAASVIAAPSGHALEQLARHPDPDIRGWAACELDRGGAE